MKKRLKILSTTVALSAIGISSATSVAVVKNSMLSNDTQLVNASRNDVTTSDLVPAQANGQNANISTSSGPITYWNDTITALDWYGNKLWEKDMSELVPVPLTEKTKMYNGSWKRSWFNWDYNRKDNILWVLGYAYQSNQTIYGFNAATGEKKYERNLGYKTGTKGSKDQPYKFISALSSGNVLAYGDPVEGYNGEGTLYNPKTNTIDKFNGNSVENVPTNMEDKKFSGKYRWYFFNLIPIANNINIAEVVAFDNGSSTIGDNSKDRASYNVYGILVDDNLNFIGNTQSNSSIFKQPVLLANGIQGYRNTTITPQRDYYTLLNNKTVTVTYNNVSLIDASDTNNIKISQVKMTDSKWIQTWTVDANDNLYFKFMNDKIVYKVSGDSLKSGANNFSPSTYLDLGGVNSNDVKNNANNFLIYNVYGYTGQLMMVNASYNVYINIYDKDKTKPTDEENAKKLYGLAIAVVPNSSDNSSGDLKGLLNTSNSFQKPADFTISDSVLSSKIPSEITKQDIQLMNDAFFKTSDNKPFIISNIDDKKGTFKITANLYKIPWFASTLPNDISPKIISYEFKTGNSDKHNAKSIDDKVSWKNLSTSTDYDFLNTLPSKISKEDVKALNPFQASFQSQRIVDSSSGEQLYPKTTYTIDKTDDNAGTIEINVEYKYVPMSVTYTNGSDTPYKFGQDSIIENQVLTYSAKQTYNVIKKTDSSSFWFTGATSQSSSDNISINVTDAPQLKNLLSASTLPSSFNYLNGSTDSTNSAFLPFINTTSSKGYPISKMKFNVTADDNAGTLKIDATMKKDYSFDNNDHTYSVTYTGLNTISKYSFGFKNSVNTIDNNKINTILPSSIDEGDILRNFITYSGYDSNDFDINLVPDDTKGTLLVQINLNKSYAQAIGLKDHGFANYVAQQTFSGFMTTDQYNTRYSVEFVSDSDSSLFDLKSRQAQEIITAFGEDGSKNGTLKVNGTDYTNIKEFVEKVLVKSKGSSIPSNWASKSNIKVNVFVQNNLGIANFYIVIPKSEMKGATSDVNLVMTYSGFAKGNEVSTGDNFSFVSDNMLKSYLLANEYITETEWNNFTPTTFAKWIETNVDKIISYKTGQYSSKVSNKDYTITTVPNTLQNTVTVTINFGDMKDKNSLSEYSIQYTL